MQTDNSHELISYLENHNFVVKRFLDKFYLVLEKNNLEINQLIYENFFEFIAPYYEGLIDLNRNVENIENLLNMSEMNSRNLTEKKILDFGCGTGISYNIGLLRGINIIGFDKCPLMRKIAESKGMNVLDELKFSMLPNNSVDIFILSYVFHLLADSKILKNIWSKLNENGIILGNFHKNQNINEFTSIVETLNGEIEYFSIETVKYYHGRYIGFKKK